MRIIIFIFLILFTFNSYSQRIVCTYSAFSDIIESLGKSNVIVGATLRDAKKYHTESIGTHLSFSVEKILKLHPDIVITLTKQLTNNNLYSKLKDNNIMLISFSANSIGDVINIINSLGKYLHSEKRADSLVGMINKQILDIEKSVDKIPSEKRKKVFLEVRGKPSLLTCGKNSIAYDVILKAGGIPLFNKDKKVFSVNRESVLINQPDFYIQQKGIMNKCPIPLKETSFKILSCVKNNKFVVLPEDLISRPSVRVAEAVITIYKLLYGENNAR